MKFCSNKNLKDFMNFYELEIARKNDRLNTELIVTIQA